MKKNFFTLISLVMLSSQLIAQVTGSFTVNGDIDKFYPVTFLDGGWINNVAVELSIGRSTVHTDANWRGSVIAHFRYHTSNWGHESNFIDADVRQFNQFHPTGSNVFIAGWQDVSEGNASTAIILWLRGGGTTYFFQSNYTVSPTVYDNIQHPLPYQQTDGPTHSYKTAVEGYVNNTGLSYNHTAYFNGTGANFFKSRIGIGTYTPDAHISFGGMGDHLSIGDPAWESKIILSTGWASASGDYTDIRVPGAAANNAIVRVQSNGNVGIGTATPQAKLAVNGDIFSQKVKVTQTGWPDYVFNSAYRLRPLSEVEQYIQQYHHLPEVPSCEDVKMNGLDLGDNQAVLLKKIEELTLYLIEQNRKLEMQIRKNEEKDQQLATQQKELDIIKKKIGL